MEIDMDPLQKQMLDDVFDAFTMLASGSYVSLMHVEGGFTRYTASAVELFGLPGEYIPNGAMDWNDYLHPEDRKRYMDAMMPLISGETQTYDLSYRVRAVTGEYHVFRVKGAVLRGSDGKPSLIGGVMINEGLSANIDHVTLLPNKNSFAEDLCARIAEGENTFALQVGVSKFDAINRVYGYSYGNRVLQETAWTIQEVVQGRADVYRMDGPRFALLTDKVTRDELAAIYDMIGYRLQRGVEVNGTRSILESNGGMISTFGAEADANTVVSCLDYAYQESKTRRHGDLVDFNGSINYEGAKSLELVDEIRSCAADGCRGFAVEHLPVINVQTERPNGSEVVVCWRSERWGTVHACDFVPVLEQDFLFEEISDFTLETALSEGVALLEDDPGYLLCLNVYRMQLESDYFIENLQHYLAKTGFPAAQLSLKFDAECRFVDVERVRAVIDELHALGILVIIDGFGSGSNSIVFLKEVPFDAVSMDSQFIGGVEQAGRDREILEHLALMASACVKHLNIGGIDTARQREIVRHMPFTTLQGEHFSGPLALDELRAKYYAK